MTLDELAVRVGEDLATLAQYIDSGLVPSTESYTAADVERIRLIQLLSRRGIDIQAITRALRGQLDLFDRYLAQLFPDGDYPAITLEEAAQRAGVDVTLLGRIWSAAGFGGPSELLTEADVTAAHSLTTALAAGFPEDALLQLVRVYADALNRVGDAEARLFHFYVHENLRTSGLSDEDLARATTEVSERLLGLVEPAVLFFHRKALTRAVRDDLVLHVAEDAGLLAPDDETGRLMAAVSFIDLARFTALTDVMGDAVAAEILNRFSELVRRCVVAHEGRIVKQIGDAFMLVFSDARSAVECALDIRQAAVAEPQFLGTRQGVHWGPILYREGDYYGATVNLAARIVTEAAADQVLVSDDVRARLSDDAEVRFIARGHRSVKHVAEPIEVFEARRPDDDDAAARVVDPVCGMTLSSVDAVARLELEDDELYFCSPACLRRYVATAN